MLVFDVLLYVEFFTRKPTVDMLNETQSEQLEKFIHVRQHSPETNSESVTSDEIDADKWI